MESEFITAAVDHLTLSGDGRWIDVRHELSAGETQEMLGRILTDTRLGTQPQVSPEKTMAAKVTAYLVGWSFRGADGSPVPITAAAVSNLRYSTFAEMVAAIEAHEAAVTNGQKKTSGGAPA